MQDILCISENAYAFLYNQNECNVSNTLLNMANTEQNHLLCGTLDNCK